MIELKDTSHVSGGDINMYMTIAAQDVGDLTNQCQMFVRDFGWQPYGNQYFVWDTFYQVMVAYG